MKLRFHCGFIAALTGLIGLNALAEVPLTVRAACVYASSPAFNDSNRETGGLKGGYTVSLTWVVVENEANPYDPTIYDGEAVSGCPKQITWEVDGLIPATLEDGLQVYPFPSVPVEWHDVSLANAAGWQLSEQPDLGIAFEATKIWDEYSNSSQSPSAWFDFLEKLWRLFRFEVNDVDSNSNRVGDDNTSPLGSSVDFVKLGDGSAGASGAGTSGSGAATTPAGAGAAPTQSGAGSSGATAGAAGTGAYAGPADADGTGSYSGAAGGGAGGGLSSGESSLPATTDSAQRESFSGYEANASNYPYASGFYNYTVASGLGYLFIADPGAASASAGTYYNPNSWMPGGLSSSGVDAGGNFDISVSPSADSTFVSGP